MALALLWVVLPLAAAEAEVTAERQRIAGERAALQAGFDAREVQCQKRFAVTACVDRVRAERREALDGLREQELQLNEAERRRRAAERVQVIGRKSAQALPPASATGQEQGQGLPSVDALASPPLPAASESDAPVGAAESGRAVPVPLPQGSVPRAAGPVVAAPPRPPGPTPEAAAAAASRASAAAQRQREAEEHQRKVQQRLDERSAKGKAAAPLPVPVQGPVPVPGKAPVPGTVPVPGKAPVPGTVPVPGKAPVPGTVPLLVPAAPASAAGR